VANVVEIVIKVDNAQAVAGLGKVQEVATRIGKDFSGLKDLANVTDAEFSKLGVSSGNVATGFEGVGNSARGMGQHITTSLDGVRLMSQEFGFRLPRALESMLARIPSVTAAIGGMMGAFAGIAVVEVFARMAEGATRLWEKYISLDAAAKEYSKTVEARDESRFMDTHSIEATRDRIKEATAAMVGFHEEAEKQQGSWWEALQNGDWMGVAQGVFMAAEGRGNEDKSLKARGQVEDLKWKSPEEQSHLDRMAIEAKYNADALLGRQKINVELAKTLKLDEEAAALRRKQDGYAAVAHPSDETSRAEDLAARQKASGSLKDLDRGETDHRIQMQNEATNSGLQGDALLLAKKEQSIAELDKKLKETAITQRTYDLEKAALETKLDNEELDRMMTIYDATQKARREASISGLKGADRIYGEQNVGIENINTDTKLSPDEAATKRQALAAETNQKLMALEDEYSEHVKQDIDSRTEASLKGFSKVAAEEQKLIDASNKAFTFGGSNVPQSVQDEMGKKRDADQASIHAQAAQQNIEIEQEIHQKTLQMATEEAQAERRVKSNGLMGWVGDNNRALAEIQVATVAARKKIDEAEADPKLSKAAYADYEQQKVLLDQKANAQIQQANAEMAHQIAGVLQGAFDDPVHYIQNMMKKMMFNIMADWMAQSKLFSGTFGRNLGGGGGTAHGSGSGMLGAITGGASASNGTIAQASTAPGYSGTVSGGGGFGGAIASSGTIAHMGMSSAAAASAGSSGVLPSIEAPMQMPSGSGAGSTTGGGTAGHATAAPGYSGTAMGSAGMSGSLQTMGSIAQMGMSTAAALNAGKTPASAGTNAGTSAAPDPWSDPKQMSSSDPSSPGFNPPSGSGLSSVAGGLLTAGVGAYTGTRGMIGAFEQGNATGILNGASSGMGMGASIGMLAGPAGAAIGAGIGAVGGALVGGIGLATGEGGNLGATNYFKTQMRPQMEAAASSYGAGGGGDALSGISQVNQIADSGFNAMSSRYGMSSADWVKAAYIDKERAYLETQINGMASGGRDYMSRSAAQFHEGGDITNFGGLSLGGNEGFIKALLGEKVTNQSASAIHGSAIDMMNDGASPSDMADHYLKSTGGAPSQSAQASTGDTHNWNVNAIDASSFEKFLTHGGGMTAVARATNRYQSQYAGDASHG